MKRFSTLAALAFVFFLSLGACGTAAPQVTPVPTLNAVEVQGTIAAGLFTMAAQTQAALPTATPIPPTATLTNTPTPTATVPAVTTLGATFTSSPTANPAGNDPCIYQTLPASLTGEKIRIRIDNPTRSTLMLSVNLQQATPQGLCGYRSYRLAAGESLVINDLIAGCYTIWAWNPDPVEYFIVTNGTSCLNTSNSWTFDISTSSIRLRP